MSKPYDEMDNVPMPQRPEPRSRFPMATFVILGFALLIFLLVLSAGFNVWFLTNPDTAFNRHEDAARAAETLQKHRAMAERDAENAQIMQQEFQRKQAAFQRENEDLQRQLEAAKELLEDARRANGKEK